MNKPQLFMNVNQALTDLVMTIKPDQLTQTMPDYAVMDPPKNLCQYLNVLSYENACVPKVLAGETDLLNNQEFKDDLLQDDALGNYNHYATVANATVRDHEDWQKQVHISYGDFPAEGYITDITIQRMTSLIDLAGAIGAKPELDDETLQGVWDITISYADTLREYGVFPPAVAVPDDAPLIDRLQGVMGRQPL